MNTLTKKHFVLSCLLLLLVQSCHHLRSVDMSIYYFYSEDKSTILYKTNHTDLFSEPQFEVVTTDVENFKIIQTCFAKDSKHIYCTYKPLDVDYTSFIWKTRELPRDKNHVYWPKGDLEDSVSCDWRILEYADPETYENMHKECELKWSRDKNYYYYKHTKVNADRATLSIQCSIIKDKNHVYTIDTASNSLQIIEYADPATYEIVNFKCWETWARDKNHYYYEFVKIDADRATTSFDSYFLYDKNYIYSVKNGVIHKTAHAGNIAVVNDRFIKDGKKLYYKRSCDADLIEIDYRNINTFEHYHKATSDYRPDRDVDVFGIDDCIYIKGVKMICDRASFEIITYPYSKDKNHVYHYGNKIPDVDRETFVVIDYNLSKDSKRVYENDKVSINSKPEDFTPDKNGLYPIDPSYKNYERRSSGGGGGGDDDD